MSCRYFKKARQQRFDRRAPDLEKNLKLKNLCETIFQQRKNHTEESELKRIKYI